MIPDANRDWKERAEAVPLLAAAQKFGAKLKRAGSEWTGPCIYCGGRDRFSISITKNKWHCRGFGGGASTVSMTMHIASLGFKEAIEAITGEPCPSGGQSRPLSDAEQAERNRARIRNEEAARARQAQEMARESDTREAALRIWESSKPIDGTLAQTYLYKRGIPPFETDVLRFHPALPYPNKPKPYPALICRVDDMDGDLCAIWRIFLRDDGRKADVIQSKLGLGPAGGGAVRFGGTGPKIAIAEGIESALGFWFLTGHKYPVFAALSTSGMVGIELPLCVESVVVAPDGDSPIRKQGEEFVPAIPAGRKAAQTLRDRLIAEGVKCVIAGEPPVGKDFCDTWNEHSREVA